MASLEELEARLTAVERQLAEVRQDAAAARVLAGAADRDVSDFRQIFSAHTRTLNALRETQLEHGERLAAAEAKFDDGFAKLNVGMAQISALLQNLIDRG